MHPTWSLLTPTLDNVGSEAIGPVDSNLAWKIAELPLCGCMHKGGEKQLGRSVSSVIDAKATGPTSQALGFCNIFCCRLSFGSRAVSAGVSK